MQTNICGLEYTQGGILMERGGEGKNKGVKVGSQYIHQSTRVVVEGGGNGGRKKDSCHHLCYSMMTTMMFLGSNNCCKEMLAREDEVDV
jgi:hypothetical protein